MEKLLLENLIESENEVKEALGTSALSKALRSTPGGTAAARTGAKSVIQSSDDVLSTLARHFGVSDDVARNAITASSGAGRTQLIKNMEKIMANDIKSGKAIFDANGKLINNSSRDISKAIALQDIYEQLGKSTKNFTIKISGSQIDDIVNGAINRQLQRVSGSYANVTGKLPKIKNTPNTPITPAPQPQVTVKGKVSEKLKNLWKTNKTFRRILKVSALPVLGGAGLVAAFALGGYTSPEDKAMAQELEESLNGFSDCILKYKDSLTVEIGENNEPYLFLQKTGDKEYDSIGGLKFYKNGVVISGDGSKKGKYNCKEAINESMNLFSI